VCHNKRRFLMLSPFRLAGIITVIFAVCGLAGAQEIAPKGSGVSINKMVVENGLAHTVRYSVTGGSPRLQALVRRVEWVENELSVVEQMQRLKLDTVVNERRVAAFRTAQRTNPYYPPGPYYPAGPLLLPVVPGHGGDGASRLQRELTGQLAYEATPEAAMNMIGFLEQLQTDLEKELKALPPQEKKAAEGPVDALRPRVDALARRDAPPPPPRPVAAPPIQVPAAAVPQQLPTPPAPAAFDQRVLQNQERVRQQSLQTQQEVMQRHREIIQQHLLLAMGLRR
jgi:hypothetical protein